MEMAVKEIVELFHKRYKGINNYDETYELWMSQLDYLPNFIPAFKEPFKIETEVIAVEPDLTRFLIIYYASSHSSSFK